jgi:hypothetical protein
MRKVNVDVEPDHGQDNDELEDIAVEVERKFSFAKSQAATIQGQGSSIIEDLARFNDDCKVESTRMPRPSTR